jgi:hypothetical protein
VLAYPHLTLSCQKKIEVELSRLSAQAAGQLLGKHQAQAQAEQNAQTQQDPIVQMQQAELQIKQKEVEIKEKQMIVDAAAQADKMALEREKMELEMEKRRYAYRCTNRASQSQTRIPAAVRSPKGGGQAR